MNNTTRIIIAGIFGDILLIESRKNSAVLLLP